MTAGNPSRASIGPWGVRLTPTANSSAKAVPKSSKISRNETGLSLRHVIGTTANCASCVATLPEKRQLAFTAGAAAVICSFDEKLNFKQRFFRARPTAIPLNPIPTVYGPTTPTNPAAEFRNRVAGRESNLGGAPFSPSTPDWSDSPSSKTWTARERVKAATCVSFSPDGKYLAVGETGYKPRVLIFSTSKESSPDCPLTCLPDHTFGVRCVAFSPNSQYLASLGASNDGFLYVWSINSRNGSASLYASNKCTSNITQIAWMGSSLVTVGTRHVKVWRTEGSPTSTPVGTPVKALAGFFAAHGASSSHRILQGRNCLLGSLLEGTFTAVAAISQSHSIVCSETGDICLLDDTNGSQRFFKVANVGFPISAATISPKGNVIVAGKSAMATFDKDTLLNAKNGDASPISGSNDSSCDENLCVALAPLGQHVVAVDDRRIIRLIHPPSEKQKDGLISELQLPAHGGPVLGVRPLSKNDVLSAAFFTWSADGTILFWTADGVCKRQMTIELEQTDATSGATVNELRVVRTLSSSNVMITGDKIGVMRIVNEKTGVCEFSLRAHAGEVTDIAVLESHSLVATSGRDRIVQLFRKSAGSWELQQTLDEHVGAVTGLVFTADGKFLISCSSDRTIVVREVLSRMEHGEMFTACTILRTITLKATPVSMTLLSERSDVLLLSTIDRCIMKYNLMNGHQISSFKATDSEGGDAVVLSSLVHLTSLHGSNILAGVSSTDKSLRLYDENGGIVGRDWGHTEGITEVTLIKPSGSTPPRSSHQKHIVTVAVDGTVFIWTFGARQTPSHYAGGTVGRHDLSSSMELMGHLPSSRRDPLSAQAPLRRVLSQSEMARFRPSSDGSDTPSHAPAPHGKRGTASRSRAAAMDKKPSRYSLSSRSTPRLDAPQSSTTSLLSASSRRRSARPLRRSPSPPSPARRSPQRLAPPRVSSLASSAMTTPTAAPSRTRASRASLVVSTATPSTASPTPVGTPNAASTPTGAQTTATTAAAAASLAHSTASLCKALRSYRKKLTTTPAPAAAAALPSEALREVERELGLTARAVGERGRRGGVDEGVMARLLSQYSERLIEMLGERIGTGDAVVAGGEGEPA